jgi:hypothetical protein
MRTAATKASDEFPLLSIDSGMKCLLSEKILAEIDDDHNAARLKIKSKRSHPLSQFKRQTLVGRSNRLGSIVKNQGSDEGAPRIPDCAAQQSLFSKSASPIAFCQAVAHLSICKPRASRQSCHSNLFAVATQWK